jgi:hypothetical protein
VCLLADCPQATPGSESDPAAAAFRQLRGRLESWQLLSFFEPLDRRVTLSAHAVDRPPDRRLFFTALRRLGSPAGLDECLYVTADPAQVGPCRALGMMVLRRGEDGGEFTDWSELPLLVAHALDAGGDENLEAALRLRLRVTQGLELLSARRLPGGGGAVQARGQVWVPLRGPGLGELEGVRVQLPATLTVSFDPRGRIASVRGRQPSGQAQAEAALQAQSLLSNGQVELGKPGLTATTHAVETDERGERYLVRKRFSAF